jgi:hypothetical protein
LYNANVDNHGAAPYLFALLPAVPVVVAALPEVAAALGASGVGSAFVAAAPEAVEAVPGISRAVVVGIAANRSEGVLNNIASNPSNSSIDRNVASFDSRFLQVADPFAEANEISGLFSPGG